MNFTKLNFDDLLTTGLKFSLNLVKKNVTKAVSDNAVKVVKKVVFGKNAKKIKNNNIRLKAGDSVTFVVTKRGLENVITEEPDHQLGEMPVEMFPLTCPHAISADNPSICEVCFKNRLKSKL